jgi:HSP20 family protein
MTKAVRAIGLERLELEKLRDEVERLFLALKEAAEAEVPPAPGAWRPTFDLCERKGEILVMIELAGVEESDIHLSLTNDYLKIEGEKRCVPRTGGVSHLCSERAYGHFSRTVNLQWPISIHDSWAEFKDGVLHVHLPRIADRRDEEFKVPVKISNE